MNSRLTIWVRERAEWTEMLEKSKALVASDLAKLTAADEAIDEMLFDSYRLTPDERAEVKAG